MQKKSARKTAASVPGPVPPPAPKSVRHVFSEEDLVELLNVDEFLPRGLDHDHATAILLAGLLKPGQRGRRYIGERYRTEQYVRRDVRSKLNTRYRDDSYEDALAWLLDERVILVTKPKTHQIVYSINPHANDATERGAPIVERIQSFVSWLNRTVER